MLEDVILLTCTHLAMFWLGYKLGFHRAIMQLIQNYLADPKDLDHAFKKLGQLKEDLNIEEDPAEEIEIDAHVQGGQVYLWRKDTNAFLAQGADIEQALAAIGPGHEGRYCIPKETVDRIRAELPKNL